MIRKLIYIIYIGVFFPMIAGAQINTDRVMAIGKNALYFEDYVLSIQYFNQVINAKPYLAEPYFYRGLAKLNLDDFQGAEADCTESIERNPYVPNTYQVRGIARIQQENYTGAIQDYEKALTFDPENTSLWHNLALSRMRSEDYAEAKADLDTLIRIAPRYIDAYLMRTEVSLKQKDTLQAMSDADKAIEMDRYNADTWASRGMLFLQRNKYADAESDLTEAIRLSVRNAGMYINRALARYYQNNLRGAMSDYDLALDIDKNNFIGHYNRGLLRAQVGDDNRAIEDFDFVLQIEPDNMMAVFNRGLLRDRTGDYAGAISDYTTVLEEYPNFLAGYQYRAEARKKTGDLKGASQDEMKVLQAQLDAQNGKTSQQTASADKTRKKSDKNMNNFRKIVVADNEDERSKYKTDYRGRVQDRNITILPQPMFVLSYYERPDEVKHQINYSKYIDDLNNRRVLPHQLLITNNEASLTEGQVKQHFASIDDITEKIVKEPDNALHYFARALDFYLVQDFDNALEDLDRTIEKDNAFFPAYFMRAMIHYKQLEYRKRDANYEIEQSQEKTLQVRALDYAMVRDDLDEVIRLAPDFAYAYYNRGNIYAVMKDYRSALVDYNKAVELDSRFSDAYFNRGLTNVFLGNNSEGVQDLSKAGELGIFSAYSVLKRFTTMKEED
ncbi:tetratricopeptide repeat protein [Bacteroides gallinaceum]|uniref:Tetratricopeptide repeat protein n=2 Tax=Bacteroidaceae TaxID=815 RepID=A0ABT7X9H2_9BACE|nr:MULTISPECIES: tetratricopeptide repeat protein [Bacteroidaceae]CCZ69470.1 tetratricopeptide TPR_1 repeat-containing protein [Bacteroides sp. CAG:702]HJD11591.1 tetratricopeptide repeat protein [Candidatus Phocaeicola caecigallinarum]MBD8041957.1 tetratricopeptide repeat protein [Phocaeicola intestinalis]MBM6659377.1 tetratricopeptide repeat protein [Bacteroides gallinaceum]MBM6720066.1 tetratricopeptide repeat protein [Bacteroides gallinaceum]